MSSVSAAPPDRIVGLDGLRGVAALVVVILHSLLLSSAFVDPFVDPRPTDADPLMWWLTYSPLHLAWEGTVAVYVFFVLSGFVLCLPARKRGVQWRAYYPSRLVRLYLPVWASVVLAIAWILFTPRLAEGSAFVQIHQDPIPIAVLRDLILVVPAQPGWTNTVLWSLKWEVLFSLLLPLYLLFAMRLRKFLPLKIALLLIVMTVGAYEGPIERPYAMSALFQMPIFALGCLLAMEWERVIAWRDRLRNARLTFVIVGVVAAACMMSYWTVFVLPVESAVIEVLAPMTRVLQVVGALLAVLLVVASPGLGAALSVTPLRWLGTRSFSLYLVHEPMIVALGRVIGEPPVAGSVLFITIPVALLMAEVFFRVVERPSHLLARRIGRTISARTRPAARPDPAPSPVPD